MKILAANWSPEQWVAIISAVTTGIASVIAASVAAWKSTNVHQQNQDIQREIKPPSNGITLGTIVERIDQVLSALAQLHFDDKGQTMVLPSSPQVKSSLPNPNPVLMPPQQDRSST